MSNTSNCARSIWGLGMSNIEPSARRARARPSLSNRPPERVREGRGQCSTSCTPLCFCTNSTSSRCSTCSTCSTCSRPDRARSLTPLTPLSSLIERSPHAGQGFARQSAAAREQLPSWLACCAALGSAPGSIWAVSTRDFERLPRDLSAWGGAIELFHGRPLNRPSDRDHTAHSFA